jgi:hypothetical protein
MDPPNVTLLARLSQNENRKIVARLPQTRIRRSWVGTTERH